MEDEHKIVYEVNLELEPEIEEAYCKFLDAHIKEILELNGFIGADLYKDDSSANPVKLVVKYRLKTSEDMENYISNHAHVMRAQAIKLFGAKFKAQRRILKTITSFKK